MKVVVIDEDGIRGPAMTEAFGREGYYFQGRFVDGELLLALCHVGDREKLARSPIVNRIGDGTVIVFFGGEGKSKNNLLDDPVCEVIRRDIQNSGYLTTTEALELLGYAEWLSGERERGSHLTWEQLEGQRPDLLRRGAQRSEFLKAMYILCEGYLAAPPAARETVRTTQWWRQGVGLEPLAALNTSWPVEQGDDEGRRSVAGLLSVLLQEDRVVEKEAVRAASEALAKQLGLGGL